MDLTILIPCYNEEKNIPDLIKRIPDMPWSIEILVVDGGSTDNTFKVAKSIKKKGLHVIRYEPSRSKGYACAYGVDRAKGKYVVIQDADMNPESIPSIVQPLFDGTATFVNGSRLVLPMEKGAMGKLNILGNKIFALMLSLSIQHKLTDSLCGYKAFPTKMLRGQLKEDNWPDFEMLIKAKRAGAKIIEVPIRYNARKYGEVKMDPFKDGWRMFKMLIKLVVNK